jgi:hypoxanthine phosphoribosyltransferase
MYDFSQDMEQILLDSSALSSVVSSLAARINADYAQREGKTLLAIPVLKGAMFFAAALLEKITLPLEVDFVSASSYRKGAQSGTLTLGAFPERDDWANVDVLFIEDIVDTGKTLSAMVAELKSRGAASVRVAALLDKPSRRDVPFAADYIGMEIPNAFVVGFGLDYAEKYRNLPYVGILRREIYEPSSH